MARSNGLGGLWMVPWSLALVGLSACGGSTSTSAAASPAAVSEKYPIVLRRDLEPGKTFHQRLKEETVEQAVMRVGSKVVSDKSKTTTLTFTGTTTPLAVGRYQPSQYVVEELTQTKEGRTSALVPEGTKITSKVVAKKWRYEIDGRPAPEELEKELQSLLGSDADDADATDDDIFGTKVPRAIGESWSADVNRLPPNENFDFDRRGASGSTRLVARRAIDGVDCLELQAKLEVPKIIVKGMPEEAQVLSASVSVDFLGMFPTDLKRPTLSQGITMDMHVQMRVTSPDGPVLVDMNVHNERTGNRD